MSLGASAILLYRGDESTNQGYMCLSIMNISRKGNSAETLFYKWNFPFQVSIVGGQPCELHSYFLRLILRILIHRGRLIAHTDSHENLLLFYCSTIMQTQQNGQTGHGDSVVGRMHPYKTLDPFNPSISLLIHNRRQRTINSIDEIGLPSVTSQGPPRIFREDNQARAQGRSHSVSQIELESQGRDTHGSQLPRPISSAIRIPVRRNAMDVNTRVSNNVDSGAYNDGQQPTPALDTGTQPPISSLPFYHDRSYVSETFLPPQDEEEAGAGTFLQLHHSSGIGSPEKPLSLYIITFLTSILPHQAYLHCLLRLPYMYFSRVTHIFENANLTFEEMKDMALQINANNKRPPLEMPKGYLRLKKSWEHFIDNLMREWKTLNIISGLLLS